MPQDPSYQELIGHLRMPFCILVGAGVSYPPPASIPTAASIMNFIVSTMPVTEIHRAILTSSLSPESVLGLGVYDFLRFEQLTEALQQSVEPDPSLLQLAMPFNCPNRYHYQLATLLMAGCKIITTNFDCLLETACDDLKIRYSVLISDEDYAAYRADPSEYPNPIFKLHGSFPHASSNRDRASQCHNGIRDD